MKICNSLFFAFIICAFFIVGCAKDDPIVDNTLDTTSLEQRNDNCVLNVSSQVNFLRSRFGECLSFEPEIPSNNQFELECGEELVIQPFNCEMPLPPIELICTDCPEYPCVELEDVTVEYDKGREEEDCCLITITVTNNSATPILIVQNGFTVMTIQPGASSSNTFSQGSNDCPFPTDFESFWIANSSNPELLCIEITLPECDELP